MLYEPFEIQGIKGLINKSTNVAVFEVPSDSDPDNRYDVTLFGETNELHCSCKGFLYREYCKHTRMIRALLEVAQG